MFAVLPRLLLALGLYAWLSAVLVAGLHPLVADHEVCEHGELVETSGPGDPGHDTEHRHGCTQDLTPLFALPEPTDEAPYEPESVDAPAETLVLGSAPARAPPLSVAPKTSPPIQA